MRLQISKMYWRYKTKIERKEKQYKIIKEKETLGVWTETETRSFPAVAAAGAAAAIAAAAPAAIEVASLRTVRERVPSAFFTGVPRKYIL